MTMLLSRLPMHRIGWVAASACVRQERVCFAIVVDDVLGIAHRCATCVTGSTERPVVAKPVSLALRLCVRRTAKTNPDCCVEAGIVVVRSTIRCRYMRVNQWIDLESTVGMHAHDKLLSFGRGEKHGRTRPADIRPLSGGPAGVKGTKLRRGGGGCSKRAVVKGSARRAGDRSDKPIIRASFAGPPTYSVLRAATGTRVVTDRDRLRPAPQQVARQSPLLVQPRSRRYCADVGRFFCCVFVIEDSFGGTQFNAVPSLGNIGGCLVRGGALLPRD